MQKGKASVAQRRSVQGVKAHLQGLLVGNCDKGAAAVAASTVADCYSDGVGAPGQIVDTICTRSQIYADIDRPS